MNVRRGLFRLWIFVTVGWAMLVAGYTWLAWDSLAPRETWLVDPIVGAPPLSAAAQASLERVNREAYVTRASQTVLGALAFIAAPSFALLVLGSGLVWVGYGFRRK